MTRIMTLLTSTLICVSCSVTTKEMRRTSDNGIIYTNNKVGIGTQEPNAVLEIDGSKSLNLLHLKTQENSLGIIATVSSEADFHGSSFIGKRSRGSQVNPKNVKEGDRITGFYGSMYSGDDYQNSSAIHFYVGPNPGPSSYPSNIRFETIASGETTRKERMRITDDGNIKIKTGDIYIEDVNSGVIMKSPNGQCWRMSVNNSGNPAFNLINCPN